MSNCKDCKYWKNYDQTCGNVEWFELEDKLVGEEFGCYTNAYDNSGLSAGVKTGPMFSCIKWESK